jgi:DASH complex subunit DAD1
MSHDDNSFFERERDKLSREITTVRSHIYCACFQPHSLQGFEELLSSTNGLNRKLEEVLEMTREYETIAALWHSFYELMSGPKPNSSMDEEQPPGLPGTGGHTLTMKQESKN